jgi:hypothetical protein
MHEMSIWEFVLNNPQWVAVFASAVFALVTAYIIWRQKCVMEQQVLMMEQQKEVMKAQGEISARHERQQNRLIQLQHEHEWMTQLNRERAEILRLGRKVHVHYIGLKSTSPMPSDLANWTELRETYYELDALLRVVDVAVYTTGRTDAWHDSLNRYLKAVFNAISGEIALQQGGISSPLVPTHPTREALKQAEADFNPIKSFADLQMTIKAEFLIFKNKWDVETSESS